MSPGTAPAKSPKSASVALWSQYSVRLASERRRPPRTCAVHQPISALGPKADIALFLFDHLVGAGKQRRRHGKAERLGGREIDGKFEISSLIDRQVGRCCTL